MHGFASLTYILPYVHLSGKYAPPSSAQTDVIVSRQRTIVNIFFIVLFANDKTNIVNIIYVIPFAGKNVLHNVAVSMGSTNQDAHSDKRNIIYAKDRMHIGGDVSADLKFTNHEIPLSTGDMIYLFSDGIVDQFGYDEYLEKEVKFTSRRLQALLDEINMLPCSEQLVRLQNTIDNWRRVGTGKESEQTDDNIMVGIRI